MIKLQLILLKHRLFIGLLFIIGFTAHAQVSTLQQLDAANIKKIHLALDQVAYVEIYAIQTDQITMETQSNGEYSQAIRFDQEIHKDELLIQSVFDEKLKGGFDKLSAHKVFSIGLILRIPVDLSVDIITDITAIKINGNYKSVHIENKFGDCELTDFEGNAHINTFDGDVFISTKDAKIEASTSTGEKNIYRFKRQKHMIRIRTVDGNIKIQPKKE